MFSPLHLLQMSRALPGLVPWLQLRPGGRTGRLRVRVGRLRCSFLCKAVPGQLDARHERQISIKIWQRTPQHTGENAGQTVTCWLLRAICRCWLPLKFIWLWLCVNLFSPWLSVVCWHVHPNFNQMLCESGVACSDASTFIIVATVQLSAIHGNRMVTSLNVFLANLETTEKTKKPN